MNFLYDYSNYYTYTQPSPTPDTSNLESLITGATGVVIVLIALLALIVLAIAIVTIIANCKMFTKAGEKWWKALIPLYNTWVQTRIANLGWWWFLIMFVLSAGIAHLANGEATNYVLSIGIALVSFNYYFNIAKKFGKSGGFAFLCTILPFIGLPILAFGSAQYDKEKKVDENGIFAIK